MEAIVHRGTHMIGGSCVEIRSGNSSLFLDAGAMLPSVGADAKPKGPELNMKKIMKPSGRVVEGVLFSHCHGDHTGLLDKVPDGIKIFMGEKTEAFLSLSSCFTGRGDPFKVDGYLKNETPLNLGPFHITPYAVDHSSSEAFAFQVEAEGKMVLYTGDFRSHGNKAKLTRILIHKLNQRAEGIDLLIMEGTVLGRPNYAIVTEKQVSQKAERFMRKTKGSVFVLSSANNIDRLVGMYKASVCSGRLFVMDPYGAHVARLYGEKIPNPWDFKNIRVFYPEYLTNRMYDAGHGDLMRELSGSRISAETLRSRSDYCLMIRDSMLHDLKGRLKPGSTGGVIHSMWKGYLETDRMKRLTNYIGENGMGFEVIHTSGHADIETLKELIEAARPKKIIPIHTEFPGQFQKHFLNALDLKDGEIVHC